MKSILLPVSLLFIILLSFLTAPAAEQDVEHSLESPVKPALAVHINFPSGSGQLVAIDQAKRIIRINPTAHKDRGWACWWYFKVTGIDPARRLWTLIT